MPAIDPDIARVVRNAALRQWELIYPGVIPGVVSPHSTRHDGRSYEVQMQTTDIVSSFTAEVILRPLFDNDDEYDEEG